jgi:hypothetical protein
MRLLPRPEIGVYHPPGGGSIEILDSNPGFFFELADR